MWVKQREGRMSKAKQYRILTQQIIHETIDGEVVVVNLETGTYYSFDKAGAIVWNCIDQGCTIDSVVSYVTTLYDGDSTTIVQEIQEFINNLEKEKLIVSSELESTETKNGHIHPILSGEKIPFANPKINKYIDMQNLLLLDPIHDVDESGWPSKKQKAE